MSDLDQSDNQYDNDIPTEQSTNAETRQPVIENPVFVQHPEAEAVTSETPQLDQDMSDVHKKRFRFPRPEMIFPRFIRNKLGVFGRVAGLILIFALVGGATSGAIIYKKHKAQPIQHFSAIVQPFSVVSTAPTSDATGLNLTDVNNIVINFSRNIDATKLAGDFFISPNISGTFSNGTDANGQSQAVFTPDKPLALGTTYSIMIHGEFSSFDGDQLGADFNFSFTTVTPDHSVIFSTGRYLQIVGSAQAGTEQDYDLSVGNAVSASGEINVYKMDKADLLKALIYGSGVSPYGYKSDNEYLNTTVNTSNKNSIKTQKGLKNGDTLKLNLDKGIYAVVATDDNQQVGYTWLVVTDLGVALRQDDQQVVVSVSSLSNQKAVKADVELMSFHNAKNLLAQSSVDGLGAISVPFASSLDWAVVSTNDDIAIVPVETPYSLADIRVDSDLSKSIAAFGLTDKPTYSVGDTVNFSGFVRNDNDVHYSVVKNKTFQVYVAGYSSGDHLADITASTDSNGLITGAFIVTASMLNETTPDSSSLGVFLVNNSSSRYDYLNNSSLAAFTVVKNSTSSNDIIVKFPKTQYLATDAISASVSVTNPDGSKLANGKVLVDIYANESRVNDKPISVALDTNGQATVPVDVNLLPGGSQQNVTVQVSTAADSNGVVAAGGASTIVYQGDGYLEFGTSRSVLKLNGTLVSRVYAKTLDGNPLANATVYYSLTQSIYNHSTNKYDVKDIADGSVKADNTGYAEINQPIGSDYPDSTSLDLKVWSSDAHNNRIEAESYYYVQTGDSNVAHSDLQLSGLDVSGSPKNVAVGDTLNLVINSPQDIHALVAIDRGRIYKYEVVDLKKGNNNYAVQVTADLLPSFSLSFSYFANGEFNVDGVTFNVSTDSKAMTVMLTPDKQTYTADSSANIQVKTSDINGNASESNVIFGVVNEKMYRLNDQPIPDILSSLYHPSETTITSSSSLTGLGSGGSGCGGGGGDFSSLINPIGTSLLWNPHVVTAADGTASVRVKLPKGTWRVFAYSMDKDSNVGSSYITVTAN